MPSYSMISQRTSVPRSNLLSGSFPETVAVHWSLFLRSSVPNKRMERTGVQPSCFMRAAVDAGRSCAVVGQRGQA